VVDYCVRPAFALARLEVRGAWVVDSANAVEFGLDEAWEGDARGIVVEGEHWFDHGAL